MQVTVPNLTDIKTYDNLLTYVRETMEAELSPYITTQEITFCWNKITKSIGEDGVLVLAANGEDEITNAHTYLLARDKMFLKEQMFPSQQCITNNQLVIAFAKIREAIAYYVDNVVSTPTPTPDPVTPINTEEVPTVEPLT